ncbi:armadillo-type protein [Phlyctochytrium arcticum]|nr:armadillo-type protein [Phlyctochytrium arcticum]
MTSVAALPPTIFPDGGSSLDIAPSAGFDPNRFTRGPAAGEQVTPDVVASARAMAKPEAMDPTKAQLAYGRRAVPKLISNLDPSLCTLPELQHTLILLADLLHTPTNIAQALSHDLVVKLGNMVDHEDVTVRQQSTEGLRVVAGHAIGRQAIVDCGTLVPLSKLFDDKDALVRRHVHHIFSLVTTHSSGVTSLLHSQLFQPLVDHLPFESLDVQRHILDTCYNCIRLGRPPFMPRDAVEGGAMAALTKLLGVGSVTDIAKRGAECVMVLSHFAEGKRLAVSSGTVSVLIDLLHHKHASVRAAAAGALMAITIDVEAKRMVVRENALPVLMDLIKDKNELVVLNSVKVITNCAEDYRGRFQLHSCIKQLQVLYESSNAQLAQAAKRAVEVISWRP